MAGGYGILQAVLEKSSVSRTPMLISTPQQTLGSFSSCKSCALFYGFLHFQQKLVSFFDALFSGELSYHGVILPPQASQKLYPVIKKFGEKAGEAMWPVGRYPQCRDRILCFP